ncbi:MAG: Sec-independent protein translocase subunit TatA/TatB, partial [Planctomycetota bacterium]
EAIPAGRVFGMIIPVPTTLAMFGLPGHWEAILLLALGVLIFGRRLPEVGRSVGRGIVEFKKGLKGIEDDIEEASSQPSQSAAIPPAQSASGTLPGGAPANTGSGHAQPASAGTQGGTHAGS